MDVTDKDATMAIDQTDSEEDWHDQLLQLNTDVAMDFVKQNLEVTNLESYCNAKEELLNDLKLQVTMLEGEVNLKLQELDHLQEKEQLLNDNLNTLNEMINSKEETEDILLENHRLLKSKRERHEQQWKQITDNYTICLKELRENYDKNPLAQKRLKLQIEVQRQRINLALLLQKVQDEKDSIRMLRDFHKRREQIKIIKFAEVMVEYNEMQKIAKEIQVYEKKFKDATEQKHKPKDDIFKVPQHKSQPININKTSFVLPPLNLSAYQINTQTFLSNKTCLKEGLKSNYSLNKDMDTILSKLNTNINMNINMNKRSRQTFSPPKQKKLKSDFGLNKSLPYTTKKAETLSLPENSKNIVSCAEVPSTQEDIFEYTSQEPNSIQLAAKSPYFSPSTSGSISNTSHMISSGGHIQNDTLGLEVSAEDNEHNMDIMETSSFVSMEEFTSPRGPENKTPSDVDVNVNNDVNVDNQVQGSNNTLFLNNMFGVANASSSQTKSNNTAAFSFLNTPSRKKSSQNIFSMF